MVKEYDTLLNTYKRMFGLVDAFHFNSQNTADIYGHFINIPKESAVISITHRGVNDHRQRREYKNNDLRLGFIGSEALYKGLPMLKRVIERLNQEGISEKISLSVYGGRTGVDKSLCNVLYKGRFDSAQMATVYDSMDLLVVPSICYETFGFTVIEAFQYGVPALVSNKVGSKDIVRQFAPHFVFDDEDELYFTLKRLTDNKDELIDYNKRIVESPWHWSMEIHAKKLEQVIYKIQK